MQTKPKLHQAWLVLFGCCMLQAGVTGIGNNTLGLYLGPLAESLQASAGDVSLFISIRSISLALAQCFVYRAYHSLNAKRLMSCALLVYALSYFMLARSSSLWQLYLAGLIMGFAAGFLMITPATFIVNNWFCTRTGFAIGLSVAAAGVGGMVMNPISSYIIVRYGWHYSVYLTVGLLVLLCIPAIWGLIVYRPEDVGQSPYGLAASTSGSPSFHATLPQTILPEKNSATFGVALVLVVILGLGTQLIHIVPSYAVSVGFSVAASGLLSSMVMAGNVGSKLLMGWLCDLYNKYLVLSSAFFLAIAAIILLVFTRSMPMACVAALFFGTIMSFATVGSPILVREIFGAANYNRIYCVFSPIASVVSSGYFAAIGYSYDLLGSYQYALLLTAALYLLGIALLLFRHRKALQLSL